MDIILSQLLSYLKMRISMLLLILGGCLVASQDVDNYFGIEDCESVYPPREGHIHTYCLPHSPLNINSDPNFKVSDENKKIIVDAHNKYRSNATNPTATDMEFMVYDDELASLAQAWAEQCVFDHDANRYSYLYNANPGQNAFFGGSNWASAIRVFHNEVKDYTYGNAEGRDGKEIGHYTQLMQHGSSRIGCGSAKCNAEWRDYLFCNYLGPQWSFAHPYTEGETCAACPLSCENNLCNCDGLFCFNGATKDINTCTCTCRDEYYGKECRQEVCPGLVCENMGTINIDTCECECYSRLFTGHNCEIKTCRHTEIYEYCDMMDEFMCEVAVNTKFMCPYLCGFCTEEERPTCEEDDLCYESPQGCQHIGAMKTPSECASLGKNGQDRETCRNDETLGGWMCSHCTSTRNVATSYCPYMCGLCRSECDGLVCLNGGSLNVDDCICVCTVGYTGSDCSEEVCPGLVCHNAGTRVMDTCSCDCMATFTGDDCTSIVEPPTVEPPTAEPTTMEPTTMQPTTVEPTPVEPTTNEPIIVETTSAPLGDCPGLVCHNDGAKVIETCTCTCRPTFGGADCSIKQCPQYEREKCATKYVQRDCTKFIRTKYQCPYMCGTCAESERPTPTTCAANPDCHLSSAGCLHMGEQETPEVCATIGFNGEGRDGDTCTNLDSGYTCQDCTKADVLRNQCPWMCGLCAAP